MDLDAILRALDLTKRHKDCARCNESIDAAIDAITKMAEQLSQHDVADMEPDDDL